MLETIINCLAVFGAFWVTLLSYIGFRVLFHAFSFAAQVGIASAQASLLARAHSDVKAKFAEKASKDEEEAKPKAK